MKILNVIYGYYPELQFGGPPLKVHTLARRLRAQGPEVAVLTFDSQRASRSESVEIDGVPVHYLPWAGRGYRQFPRDTNAIRERVAESDIVHLYGLYNLICPVAARACRKLSKPYLFEPLGMYPPRQRNLLPKRLFNATLTKWMLGHAERIVATSQPEFEDLKKVFPTNRIIIRRNGIDLAAFQHLPARERYLERYDLETDKRYILYLGRISRIKNLESAIRAFKEANLQDCLFLIVGPCEEMDYLKKLNSLIQNLDLRDTVRILPEIGHDNKNEAFAAADLVILPSISESFGNAAGEAVAANKPVLVTTGCGIASVIDGRAGLAVAPDVDSLADGMRQLLENPETALAHTRRRAEAARELSWDEPVNETIKLYKQILRDERD